MSYYSMRYAGLRMRENIHFHFNVEFLNHMRCVARAYAGGLRMRHPRGTGGRGKVLNFMAVQHQMFLFIIFGRIVVQSQ